MLYEHRTGLTGMGLNCVHQPCRSLSAHVVLYHLLFSHAWGHECRLTAMHSFIAVIYCTACNKCTTCLLLVDLLVSPCITQASMLLPVPLTMRGQQHTPNHHHQNAAVAGAPLLSARNCPYAEHQHRHHCLHATTTRVGTSWGVQHKYAKCMCGMHTATH